MSLKHLFIQNQGHFQYASLGDVSVRILSFLNISRKYGLDSGYIPISPSLKVLWSDVLGQDRVFDNYESAPEEYRNGVMHKPTSLDLNYGWAAHTVFESVFWENGFFDTKGLMIETPIVYKCNYKDKNALIYPDEKTDGNRIYNSAFWLKVCEDLTSKGYGIICCGNKSSSNLKEFYEKQKFAEEYAANIENLKKCISKCSLALGASTGPTWACLFSDIKQVVFESKKSPHGYWHFDRCQEVLSKKVQIVQTLDSAMRSYE